MIVGDVPRAAEPALSLLNQEASDLFAWAREQRISDRDLVLMVVEDGGHHQLIATDRSGAGDVLETTKGEHTPTQVLDVLNRCLRRLAEPNPPGSFLIIWALKQSMGYAVARRVPLAPGGQA